MDGPVEHAVDVSRKGLLGRALRELGLELVDLLHAHVTALADLRQTNEVTKVRLGSEFRMTRLRVSE
jgi:hypothetical protein